MNYARLRISQIVYDRVSGKFPYSSRLLIDAVLVDRIATSIHENGLLQPIAVKADTLEGISGNHRLLAYCRYLRDLGLDPDQEEVDVHLVDCTEAEAVLIALEENELREDLTNQERLRGYIKAHKRNPTGVHKVFKIDEATATQLALWENGDLDRSDIPVKKIVSRDWIRVINTKLSRHPDLRCEFLDKIKKSTFQNVWSVETLNEEIDRALLGYGVKFEQGNTWNAVPLRKCLGVCRDVPAVLAEKNQPVPTCPFLKLSTDENYLFIPGEGGDARIKLPGLTQVVHPSTVVQATCEVRGELAPIAGRTSAFCVDEGWGRSGSCFSQLEATEAMKQIETYRSQGIPVFLRSNLERFKDNGRFVWWKPVYAGKACTPEKCIHAKDDLCGYGLCIEPAGITSMVCFNGDCGGSQQHMLELDREDAAKKEKMGREQAVRRLYEETIRMSLSRVVEPEAMIADPIFHSLEDALLPFWDVSTKARMVFYSLLVNPGAEWGVELRKLSSAQIKRIYIGDVEEGIKDKIKEGFRILRAEILGRDNGRGQWIACLANLHKVKSIEHDPEKVVEAAAQYISPTAKPLMQG